MNQVNRLSNHAELTVFDAAMLKMAVVENTPFRSAYLALVLIESGKMGMRLNLRDFVFERSCMFFINPNMIGELKSISPDCELTGICFTPEFMMNSGVTLTSNEVIDLFTGNYEPAIKLSSEDEKNIGTLLNFIKDKLKRQPSEHDGPVIHYAFLTLMFEGAAISKKHRLLQTRLKISSGEDMTLRFLKLLGIHFKQERSVQFYADALYITTRHLSHVIKAVTGKTAGELIDEAVIIEARVLLSNGSYNISQVSDMLNFTNPAFFSKFFKKRVGLTPSECRLLH
jgi:AraC-like DNA-binding protein